MSEGKVAIICAECRWLLAGLPAVEAAAVPRCLSCGGSALVHEPVADHVRMARWPGPTDDGRPGWAVFSRKELDPVLVASEARN